MPGQQMEAFTIVDLDPVKCVGFNNIVINCGINNIRNVSVESDEHVHDAYVLWKSKIYQITEVNKRTRVYVDTLLPTKIGDYIITWN